MTVCFGVEIDKNEIGAFNSCDGLGCEVVIEQREEGGNNGFVWQLPTRVKYGITGLSRPVGRDSAKLTAWLASRHRRPAAHRHHHGPYPEQRDRGHLNLDGVIPVRWSGPQLNLDSKVATETIELAHHGFLRPEVAG